MKAYTAKKIRKRKEAAGKTLHQCNLLLFESEGRDTWKDNKVIKEQRVHYTPRIHACNCKAICLYLYTCIQIWYRKPLVKIPPKGVLHKLYYVASLDGQRQAKLLLISLKRVFELQIHDDDDDDCFNSFLEFALIMAERKKKRKAFGKREKLIQSRYSSIIIIIIMMPCWIQQYPWPLALNNT